MLSNLSKSCSYNKSIQPFSITFLSRISAALKDVALEELVRARVEDGQTQDKAKTDREKRQEDARKIQEQLAVLQPFMEGQSFTSSEQDDSAR